MKLLGDRGAVRQLLLSDYWPWLDTVAFQAETLLPMLDAYPEQIRRDIAKADALDTIHLGASWTSWVEDAIAPLRGVDATSADALRDRWVLIEGNVAKLNTLLAKARTRGDEESLHQIYRSKADGHEQHFAKSEFVPLAHLNRLNAIPDEEEN